MIVTAATALAGPNARTAEFTLAGRFANGDIDEKEYRARLDVLRSQYPADPARSERNRCPQPAL